MSARIFQYISRVRLPMGLPRCADSIRYYAKASTMIDRTYDSELDGFEALSDVKTFSQEDDQGTNEYKQLPDDCQYITQHREQLIRFRKFLQDRHAEKRAFQSYTANELSGQLEDFMSQVEKERASQTGFLADKATALLLDQELKAFQKMDRGIRKTLHLNNGYTHVFDAILTNFEVFDTMERNLQEKKTSLKDTRHKHNLRLEYKKIPEDASYLQAYLHELKLFRAFLGHEFAASSKAGILDALNSLLSNMNQTSKYATDDKKLHRFAKMAWGVRYILNTCNDPCALDVALKNFDVFDKTNHTIQKRHAARFLANSEGVQLNEPKESAPIIEEAPEDGLEKSTIKAKLSKLLLDSLLSESKPLEKNLAAILEKRLHMPSSSACVESQVQTSETPENLDNLTAEQIRKNYKYNLSKKVPPHVVPVHSKPDLGKLEGFLRQVKQVKDNDRETIFRHKKTYEWISARNCRDPRSPKLNFLEPNAIYKEHVADAFRRARGVSESDLFFPKVEGTRNTGTNFVESALTREYLLLANNGATILSADNPLGKDHTAEDMFSIFSRIDFPEKYLRHIAKLQAQNWKLIGGGGPKLLLVFERPASKFKDKVGGNSWVGLRNGLALVGTVIVGVVGFNHYGFTAKVDETADLN
ncbi:hypothetical protein BABINDRAFT_11010 [Babjeviella inositovora NRRL Y-12698]|uniref:Uncharacterized protein n=1 Tax=Babjeviella inositovora NRRL Y-12698 TaxID=984486 RepID=A0A1E3QZU5_9ASCO|nr:uncharacterized protein BABINDRAFT_11010 [Babjeviella inositovora NRRL Y-12698]ODQ82607.1 hypothetical protein BABINDRAFT_11010 [Babjeviella inositovora NRRL Y-12698]